MTDKVNLPLKPCPYCKSNTVEMGSHQIMMGMPGPVPVTIYAVRCRHCGTRGPEADEFTIGGHEKAKAAAVTMWDLFPRPELTP